MHRNFTDFLIGFSLGLFFLGILAAGILSYL